jgi:serine/threonine-protein kinase
MSRPESVVINERLWTFGQLLSDGGFGWVYEATSDGETAAIKLVPKDPGAELELLVAENLRGAANVIPVWGTGEFGKYWAILMPLAEQSLQDYLEDIQRPLSEAEAGPILIDIMRALVDVQKVGVVPRPRRSRSLSGSAVKSPAWWG